MLELNFPKYPTNVFTVHRLLMSQRTAHHLRKCVFFTHGKTSDFEMFEDLVDLHSVQGQTKGSA
jgi:hypothetical protein